MKRKADPVEAYARDVVAKRVLAGPWVRLACARHLTDLKERKRTGLDWRADRAQDAIDFFPEMLPLEDGRPFELQPFQEFIVGSLFGWYGPEGFRRFRTGYVEAGKGSGKTPLAAGIGLYGLVADGEPAAEIYSAASTQDQARIVWKDAHRMVSQSPELNAAISSQVGSLTIPATNSVFRSVSSEHKGLDGKRVHMGLIDELQEHPSALVVDKIRAGTKGRRNALIFEITNSGFDRHSVCWNHHEYSLKVLEGVIENDSWFAYVCALDKGDSWKDPKVWPKANPGLGTILPLRYVEEQVAEAIGMPTKENIVRRLNCCEWTEQSVRAIPMPTWDYGSGRVDAEALRGRTCFGGLDLARVRDLSAFVLDFPPLVEGEPWQVLAWFWVPEDNIAERSLRDHVPYDVWVRDGLIETTPGNTTDYSFIGRRVVELAGQYDIRCVGYDRTFAGELVQDLMAEGIPLKEFGQGFLSLASPTAELLRRIHARQLRHGGNAVLRWNASNLAVQTDAAGNVKPDKERSVERIDGIAALVNAIGMEQKSEKDLGPSVYEERGLLAF